MKEYLSRPHVLTPPNNGKPLKLYISTIADSIAILLAQDNKEGHEQVVF